MKETDRIIKLFEDLYHGTPWLDVTFMDTLNSLSPEQAAKKLHPGWNSAWEVLNHLTSWRMAILERIEGKEVGAENNFFAPIADQSLPAWNKTLEKFRESQDKWIQYLRNFSENDFDKVPDKKPFSKYELIHGILLHDAYHLGQIRILVKSV